jgi:D-alanyl-D-alanine carboxypeptidase
MIAHRSAPSDENLARGALKMEAWLRSAIGYADAWLAYHMEQTDQPGCSIAVAYDQQVVFEKAFGIADLGAGERMTERHKFRVASHSKTFTAAGVLKLKDEGRLRLDDRVGTFVTGLDPTVANVTVSQLLSHSAGLTRDGSDGGYFTDQRLFPSREELLDELGKPTLIAAGQRYKYSNHGFGLLGLVIEAVAGEPYEMWIMREIVDAAGLRETTADMPAEGGKPFARGHTARLPLLYRAVIPGHNKTDALMSATGFVSVPSDLAQFFSQLSPTAKSSILSVESRRDMTRPHWRDRESVLGRSYGLGLHCGQIGGWDYFGHLGRFQGYSTRTAVFPEINLAVSVLTNASDGPAAQWLDGVVHIIRQFREGGAPAEQSASWNGRWWTLSGAMDLVAIGSKVHVFPPGVYPPFSEASEVTLTEQDRGIVTRAPGAERFGEIVRRVRDSEGAAIEVWIGGLRLSAEEAIKSDIVARYGPRNY